MDVSQHLEKRLIWWHFSKFGVIRFWLELRLNFKVWNVGKFKYLKQVTNINCNENLNIRWFDKFEPAYRLILVQDHSWGLLVTEWTIKIFVEKASPDNGIEIYLGEQSQHRNWKMKGVDEKAFGKKVGKSSIWGASPCRARRWQLAMWDRVMRQRACVSQCRAAKHATLDVSYTAGWQRLGIDHPVTLGPGYGP